MSFIDEIAPHAQEIGIENDILPSLIIGQAILESASGKSELAQKGNNLFGIKGAYNGESVTILTTEFVNGEKINVSAAFCKYPSWRESIEALANKYVNGVSWNRDLYRAVVGEKDYRKAVQAVKDAGYATDPAYVSKVVNVIEKYNLTKYDQIPERVDKMTKIFIDAGHGGTDSGAVGNGLKEKNVTLQIANRVRNMLQNEYQNVSINMSRTGDQTLSLKQRTDMANAWGADFFLSIHINSGGGTGYEDYIYDKLSDSSSTAKLRNVIHEEIAKLIGMRNRGKKKANFHVLRESKMHAVLTENGFIDNASDAALMKSTAWLDKVARGHVNGLARAFGLKKKSGIATPTVPKEEPTVDKSQPSAWAKKDWDEAVANGYFDGTRPQDNITREEMAVVVNRLRQNMLPLIQGKK
ncbi:N-acetylmuramoyl-L-alanine amidase [Bacillus chungangensis]|uniref:N-acetylmuramoyl-L-alanine amidase n=2 Tax=Bacillus chungangensis TaxID=587633 RepID=A0ABT9WUB0_9BACI|nr:N-acetylmuramoyl-L-alanine amidase [Bacillus chungangensis]